MRTMPKLLKKPVLDPAVFTDDLEFDRPGWTARRIVSFQDDYDDYEQSEDSENPTEKDHPQNSSELKLSKTNQFKNYLSNLPERFEKALNVRNGITMKQFSLRMKSEVSDLPMQEIHFEGFFFKNHPVYFRKNCLFITRADNSCAKQPYPFLSDVVVSALNKLSLSNNEIDYIVINQVNSTELRGMVHKLVLERAQARNYDRLIQFTEEEIEEYKSSPGMLSKPVLAIAGRLNKEISGVSFNILKNDLLISLS